MAKFKIKYKRDLCIGCGSCVMVCSRFWEMGGDYKASLVGSNLNRETNMHELELGEPSCNLDAVSVCPYKLIDTEEC